MTKELKLRKYIYLQTTKPAEEDKEINKDHKINKEEEINKEEDSDKYESNKEEEEVPDKESILKPAVFPNQSFKPICSLTKMSTKVSATKKKRTSVKHPNTTEGAFLSVESSLSYLP